jgi:hypothetical protein
MTDSHGDSFVEEEKRVISSGTFKRDFATALVDQEATDPSIARG